MEEPLNLQEVENEEERHVTNPVTLPKPIVKKYLGEVTEHVRKGNDFYFSDGEASVEVKVVSDEIIRVRLAPHKAFLDDFSYAVPGITNVPSEVAFAEETEYYEVATSSVRCRISKQDFLVSFADREGEVINADETSMHWEENADFGGYYVYCTKKSGHDEQFFGLGDKPTDFNLRGKRLSLWNSDTYAFGKDQDPLYRSIPFYMGLAGGKAYGLFFDNTFQSYFDFAAEDPEKVSFWADGGELQYYYIHGPAMKDVVKRYASLTGTHDMPPLWALGYHQCRWSYYPESKVKSVAAEFRERKIPCDAIYLDIDYMDGYRCFTWNNTHFPDPKRMIGELAEQGFRVVTIVDPGIKVDDAYKVFREGKQKRFFCRRSDDYFMEGYVWPGRCQFPDFTNPKVRKWWGKLFGEHVDNGVAGVWNDMNEPAVFGKGTFPMDVRHNYDGYRGSHRKAHNIYGMQMVRATREGLKKLQKNKRPFTITRAGYAGVQRYSSVWTGDNVATWEHLKLANVMCQRLSISGISFCGSDIGGFTGQPDGELFTRWIQLGVFAPLMRAHSAGDTPEREPWSFGEYFESINRRYIELRYRLLPYIYSSFWEHNHYLLPVLRPLIMLEQENPENHCRENEFAFGDKLLVAPVCESGRQEQEVYLPAGRWYDYWTTQPYQGGALHTVKADLETLPLFVKAGAVIPEYPLMQYTDEFEPEEMILNVYHKEGTEESLLYEDHHDTFAYEQQIYLEKWFKISGAADSLVIGQEMEGLYTPRYDAYLLRLRGLPFMPVKILCDDAEVEFSGAQEEILLKADPGFKMIRVLAS